MSFKKTTLALTLALVATLALPVAAAHWRGSYVDSTGTLVTTTATNWNAPHEHEIILGGGVEAGIYSSTFQRLCFDSSTLALTWGTQSSCDVPNQGGVFPPIRGHGLDLARCFDVDGIGLLDQPPGARTTNGLSSIVVDWNGQLGPGPSPYFFADYFAHPNRARFPLISGGDPNPTGATPAFLPTVTAFVPGVVQVAIRYIGAGGGQLGTGDRMLPGVDVGDNDFEVCVGGAQFTYAINSGTRLKTTNDPVTGTNGAGAGLNDWRGIGGDCAYDVAACAPVVGNGIADTSFIPLGILLSPTTVSFGVIPYTVCHALGGAGCTNIPEPGSGARLGNGIEGNAVYSSLQACVWHAFQTDRLHAGSGRLYSGVAALWGTATAIGDRTCWPERLVRSSPLATAIYVPSSQTTAGWNPDVLPATSDEVEMLNAFVDDLTIQPFHGFDSGCTTGTPVAASASCASPTMAPPTSWVVPPNTITAFAAVFQP